MYFILCIIHIIASGYHAVRLSRKMVLHTDSGSIDTVNGLVETPEYARFSDS